MTIQENLETVFKYLKGYKKELKQIGAIGLMILIALFGINYLKKTGFNALDMDSIIKPTTFLVVFAPVLIFIIYKTRLQGRGRQQEKRIQRLLFPILIILIIIYSLFSILKSVYQIIF